jgi:FdhD protein
MLPDPRTSSPALAEARVLRLQEGERGAERDDRVAVEAPLEVRLGNRTATVLMRTPGDDEDLVRGFLFNEGIIRTAGDVAALRRPAGLGALEVGNVIAVDLAVAPARRPSERFLYSSASCGVCGKTSISSLEVNGEPSTSDLRVRRSVLAALPARLRAAQASFAESGGLHASGLFTAEGDLVALREDVGRHNALDKLVGFALAAGMVPLEQHVLLLSGRTSYELVQKSVVARLPVIAAVGAPSSYAVELARRFGITLVGFLKPESMNVYAGAERIVG